MDMRTPPTVPATPAATDYATTHCRVCAAGWTRTGIKGGVVTVCLLDRERVMADMTSCDRFELRDTLARPVSSAA